MALRHEIRMKMLMSSGMEIPNSSVNAPSKKSKGIAQAKVTKKVTQQPASALSHHI